MIKEELFKKGGDNSAAKKEDNMDPIITIEVEDTDLVKKESDKKEKSNQSENVKIDVFEDDETDDDDDF